tara:strand:- start:39 stop:173 length:135 start_codon:yes stop_codon:yes gene_type:complete
LKEKDSKIKVTEDSYLKVKGMFETSRAQIEEIEQRYKESKEALE